MINNAYHISFSFDRNQIGEMVIPASSPEAAKEKLVSMLEKQELKNLEVQDVAMNGYHVAFTYDQSHPGVITIPATSSEEAQAKLKDILNDQSCKNYVVKEVINVEDIPSIKAILAHQTEQQAEADALLADVESTEPTKVIN